MGSRAPCRHLRAPRPASMFGVRRQSVLAVTSPRCPQGTAAMQGTPKLDRLRHRPRDSGQQGPPGLATGGLPHRVHRDDSEPTGKCRRRREAAAPAPACSPRGGQTPRDRPGPPTPDKGSWGYVHTLGPDGKNGQGPACPGGDPCRPTPPRSSPSEVRASVSVVLQLSTMSHRRTVRSQEALARTDFVGLKHRPLMGPS